MIRPLTFHSLTRLNELNDECVQEAGSGYLSESQVRDSITSKSNGDS